MITVHCDSIQNTSNILIILNYTQASYLFLIFSNARNIPRKESYRLVLYGVQK